MSELCGRTSLKELSRILFKQRVNSYFWRTYDQKEIDYVEETAGTITGYELKFSEKQN